MESYFSSLGFEIIYPEDFLNFNDQLIFFNEVKIIAGVTNAGLLNSIFMQPGGIVLELTVPLIVYGTEKIHHQYKGLADVKEHMYLSLFSMRKVDDFIDKIENNKMIKELLLSS
jgi:capsular polysaccharide biosynthesis protein